MVEHDLHIGKFLKKLDELGIADNTIVFYSTDNGPHMNTWPDAAMTPFRGEKNTNWEGGWRVPAMVRWPGHIKAGTWSNQIVHHMDWLPTFLAIAGAPDVKAKLLTGYQANGRDYRVHLDGYDILPMLTGQTDKSPRHEIFYFSDDGDMTALRYNDWKAIFLEQRAEATFQSWREPFVHLRVPLLENLRRDPYERGMVTSNTYDDWFLERSFLLLAAKDYVGKFMMTFKEYPPRQKAGSFNLDNVMEQWTDEDPEGGKARVLIDAVPQVKVSVVGCVLVLQPLDTGVNEARLARELVLAWESGATPIVALTKADLVDANAIAAGVESATVNSPDVAVVVVSTQQRSGLDELRDVLDAGDRAGQPRVLALLGPSGAGKSTLANALAGHEVQLTAEVRDSDRRGRHTTTAGQMLTLDDHTWLIDTPGIRGVGLWAADDGLERAFADLSPFAQDCRFDDCSHRSEPDCGLRAAVERGDLAPVRLELWLRLVDELEDLEADLERRERAVERDDNQRARHRARGRDRSDD
jgi:ribosome small subunit-dependent GTPase A